MVCHFFIHKHITFFSQKKKVNLMQIEMSHTYTLFTPGSFNIMYAWKGFEKNWPKIWAMLSHPIYSVHHWGEEEDTELGAWCCLQRPKKKWLAFHCSKASTLRVQFLSALGSYELLLLQFLPLNFFTIFKLHNKCL